MAVAAFRVPQLAQVRTAPAGAGAGAWSACPQLEQNLAFSAFRVPQAPQWMQDAGLEWFFRLCAEPKRLWRRYLFLNPSYLFLIALQRLRLSQFSTDGQPPRRELLFG